MAPAATRTPMGNFWVCHRGRAAISSRAIVSLLAFSRVPRGVGRCCAVALALPSIVACTEFAPGDDVLASDGQQLLDGEPPEGEDWRCVTSESVDAVDAALVTAAESSQRITQAIQFLNIATGTVPPEATVHACARADVACAAPLTMDYPLTAEGWVNIPLPVGFNGYLEIEAETILPTMLFLGEPLRRPRPSNYPVALIEHNILPGVSGATGTMQNSTTGLLTIRVFDCQDVSASGVKFAQQQDAVEWYYVDGLPSSEATETSSEGLGGFINTPPGVTTITTTGRAGQQLASNKLVAVRAGWLTAVRMWIGEEAADAD